MTETTVPNRLKALRQSAGLTVRSMAHLMDMSSSGYSHYETASRFKDTYLPLGVAMKVASILGPRGVDRSAVMALAGVRDNRPLRTGDNGTPGFGEGDAAIWTGSPDEEARMQACIAALLPGVERAATYRITRDMLGLALLSGDLVIVNRRAAPGPGQLALGNVRNDDDEMVAVLGRIVGNTLVFADTLTRGTVFDLDSPDVAVYHPVVGVFRKVG